MNEVVDILLARYFGGEASKEELDELDLWLAESRENELYFEQMTFLYEKLIPIPVSFVPDLEQAQVDFKAYINKSREKYKKPTLRLTPFFRAIAASILLIVSVSSLYFIFQKPAIEQIHIASNDTEVTYTLFEDVEVLLSPESQIVYKSAESNEVELKGKATFTVNSHHNKELLVLAGDTYIKDIGTVFTVTANSQNEPIIVEVSEGEVLFFTNENTGIHIKQYEKGVYNPLTKEFSIVANEKISEEIVFNEVSLKQVISVLEYQYGVNILAEVGLLDEMQVSATFDGNESIDTILTIIAETLSARLIKNGNTFTIIQ